MLSAEDRLAFLCGFKMALESSRTTASRKVDSLAIVVGGGYEALYSAMEKASNISDKDIEMIIENRHKGLI